MTRRERNISAAVGVAVILLVSVPSCEAWSNGNQAHNATRSEHGMGEVKSYKSPGRAEDSRRDTIMTEQQTVERIRQKDWSLVEEPGKLSADAAPGIMALLDDDDSQVRELAIYCLNELGGGVARRGFLRALKDPDDQVSSAACQFLQTNHDKGDLPILLEELTTNEDEYVREQVALVIGRIGESRTIATLKSRQ